MSNINLNWANIGALLATLAGIAGTVITPIYGSNIATSVQATLQALSGLLLAISGWHVTSVAATNAKLKAAARLNPATVVHIHT